MKNKKTYPGLRRSNKGIAPSFDFCIYREHQPDLLIECNGLQHYQPVEHYGGQERFKNQSERDQHKRDYVTRRGLELIELDEHDRLLLAQMSPERLPDVRHERNHDRERLRRESWAPNPRIE